MSADPLVQFCLTNNSGAFGADGSQPGESVRHHYLNHPSLAGNYLWMCFRSSCDTSSHPTVTVKDDTGTTWTQLTGSPFAETTNGTMFTFYYRANCPAGILRIDCDFGTSATVVPGAYSAGCYGEFCHVKAASMVDQVNHKLTANVSSPTWSSGNITTTAVDLILHVACTQGPGPYTSNVSLQSGYTGLGVDLVTGMAAEYNWDVATGTYNPTMTPPSDDIAGIVSLTVALVMDTSQGTVPDFSKPRILRTQWVDIYDAVAVSHNLAIQICCTGGAMLMSATQLADPGFISDTTNGTWHESTVSTGNSAGSCRFDYVLKPTTSATGLTAKVGSIAVGDKATTVIYDVACTVGLVLDNEVTNLGNKSDLTTPLSPGSITPSASGGVCFFTIAVDNPTMEDLTDNATFTGCQPWAPEYDGGETHIAEDDSWFVAFPTSTATLTPGVNYTPAGPIVNNWVYAAISFVPASYQKWGLESGPPGAWALESGTGYWITEASAPAPSGTNYLRFAPDSTNASEGPLRFATLLRLAPNTIDASELRLRVAALLRAVSASSHLSEGTLKPVSALRSAGATIHASELLLRRVAVLRLNPNTVQASEGSVRPGSWIRNAPATAHQSEAPSRVGSWIRRAADALHGSELAQRAGSWVRSAAASLHGSEQSLVGRVLLRFANASAHVSESARRVLVWLRYANATAQVSEGSLRFAAWLRTAANSMHASETPTRLVVALRQANNTLHASELWTRTASWVRTAAESLHGSEQTPVSRFFLRFANAAAHVGESAFRVLVWLRFANATAHVGEGSTRIGAWLRTAANSLHASEGAARVMALVRRAADTLHASELLTRTVAALRIAPNTVHASEGTSRLKALAARVIGDLVHGSEALNWLRTRLVVIYANATMHAGEAVQRLASILRLVSATAHVSEVRVRLATYLRTQGSTLQSTELVRRPGLWTRLSSATAHVGESQNRVKVWAARVVADTLHAVEATNRFLQRLWIIVVNATQQASEQVVRRVQVLRQVGSALHAAEALVRRAQVLRIAGAQLQGAEGIFRARLIVRVVSSVLNGYEVLRDFLFGIIYPAKSPTSVVLVSRAVTLELEAFTPTDAQLVSRSTAVELKDTPTN